jgi:peptidyl-prolyl cis-trans isomerase SurA
MQMTPGQTSNVIKTPEGYRIIKLLLREPAGQRELADPKVQQSIRERLMNQKEQLLQAAYYETARNETKVTNYFANSIVENKQAGK